MPFVDFRYPIKLKEGGGFETPEFQEAKHLGLLAANMDRAPVLEVGSDLKIGQSRSIERYVSRLCGFMGSNDAEAALIDCIAEHTRDIKEKWGKIRMIGGMGSNAEKDAAMKKWFADGEYKEWLTKLERSLPASRSPGFSVGSKLSYSDICIWHLLREQFDDREAATKVSDEFPMLTEIANCVASNAELQAWLASRPNTMF